MTMKLSQSVYLYVKFMDGLEHTKEDLYIKYLGVL